MPKYPYMPFHVDDYISATDELSTLEHGAYLLLLFKAWKNPDCALPDDDAKLARIVKQPLAVWTKRLRPVLEPFFTVADGEWRQKRQGEVRKHVAKVTDQRRRAAEARWHPETAPPRGGSDDGSPPNSLTDNDPDDANAHPLAARSYKLEKKETPTSSSGVFPPAPVREAAAAPEGASASIEGRVLARVEAEGRDARQAAGLLATLKSEFGRQTCDSVLADALRAAKSNVMEIVTRKAGDERARRMRAEMETQQSANDGWSADALIAAAARRQVAEAQAERDAADGWPVVTECPRLGGPE